MASNYPPGFSGAPGAADMVEQRCPNGHTWEAPMFPELGGLFYVDEETGPYCPVCGEQHDEDAPEPSRAAVEVFYYRGDWDGGRFAQAACKPCKLVFNSGHHYPVTPDGLTLAQRQCDGHNAIHHQPNAEDK